MSYGFLKEASTCRIEAGFDVPFQEPWCHFAPSCERGMALFDGIRTASFFPESVRIRVSLCFRNLIHTLQIQRLHRAVLHRRDPEGTLLPIGFGNIQSSQL